MEWCYCCWISNVSFNTIGSITTLNEEQKKTFIKSCPTKVYSYNTDHDTIDIEDVSRCTYCGECEKKAIEYEQPKLVNIKQSEDTFIFNIETTGSLTASNVLYKAINILQLKLEMLQQLMTNIVL